MAASKQALIGAALGTAVRLFMGLLAKFVLAFVMIGVAVAAYWW